MARINEDIKELLRILRILPDPLVRELLARARALVTAEKQRQRRQQNGRKTGAKWAQNLQK